VISQNVQMGPTRMYEGRGFEPRGDAGIASSPSWSGALHPEAWRVASKLDGGAKVGEIAEATADFRDEYYALKTCVREAKGKEKTPRVVTSGAIDLARVSWGETQVRLHGKAWLKPVADVKRVGGEKGAAERIRSRLVPKVLVATQTKVIEVVCDEEAILLPVTPLISVTARQAGMKLEMIAAAIASPVACLWAAAHVGGAGMSSEAIKLAARQVREIPLPTDAVAWGRGAECLAQAQRVGADETKRRELLEGFARAMVCGYGLTETDRAFALQWWMERAFA